MKKLLIMVVLFLQIGTFLQAQNFSSSDPNYIKYVQLGEKALNSMQYDSCITYYQEAFLIKQVSVLSTLRMAACAYSSGNKDEFKKQLSMAFDIDWAEAKTLVDRYPEFEYVRGTSFETDINARWKKEAKAAGLDLNLMAEFDKILETDQAQRQEMRPISDKYGWDSPKMDSLWKIQSYSDSVNTTRIVEILEKDGYPGKAKVGSGHQGTAFLVIQHAEHDIQVKYLPMISAAADAGEVRWASVALLVDRVRQGEGKKQIYGSQVSRDPETNEYFFGEIEQPYKVDSIRASVGLGILNDYAKNWDFSYDPKKHMERHSARKKE